MASVRVNPSTGKLFIDFRWEGKRQRRYLELENTSANVKRAALLASAISRAVKLRVYSDDEFFSNAQNHPDMTSALVNESRSLNVGSSAHTARHTDEISFQDFAGLWLSTFSPTWRRSYRLNVEGIVRKLLVPHFGGLAISALTRAGVLAYRTQLADQTGKKKQTIAAVRINYVMGVLSRILAEAALQHDLINPCVGVKPLKKAKTLISPLSLLEVRQFLDGVRADFRDYYIVRFFTGMRTGEIDGLKWKHVDLDDGFIHVRETVVAGVEDTTKNDSSIRDIRMSAEVRDALSRQRDRTEPIGEFVFCTANGAHLDHVNVSKRVWHPTLVFLGMKRRRPYESRHTYASIALGAGESPEWVARQLGHSSTQMLFSVYSRYIPNLTRNDGSAVDRVLQTVFSSQAPKARASEIKS